MRHTRGGAGNLRPIGQIVRVGIGIVEKAPVLDHQSTGVGAVAPGVPTRRRGAGQLGQDRDRFGHVRAFSVFVHLLITDPAQAMRRDLVTQIEVCRHRLGVPLQRARDPEYRQRQIALLEDTQHAPKSRARAVFEEALHAHVAHRKCGCADDLREEGFGRRISVENTILGAFLMIEDELQRDPRPVGPARMRRTAAVAAQVARIGHCRTPNTVRRSTPVSLRSSSMRSSQR